MLLRLITSAAVSIPVPLVGLSWLRYRILPILVTKSLNTALTFLQSYQDDKMLWTASATLSRGRLNL